MRTINLLSPLPTITQPLTIDGYTQPGSAPNSLPIGSDAVLNIELNGASAGAAIGLRIAESGGITVRGLVINRFQEGGIRIDAVTEGGGEIVGNFIGTDATGTTSLGNINYGIVAVTRDSPPIIGDGSPAGRNVISGNSGTGITVSSGGLGIVIVGNYIGTDKDGTADLGNTSHGVLIANSNFNSVGTGGVGNVISGNNGSGVAVLKDFGFTASTNFVQANFIGVDASGTAALGNNGSGMIVQAANNVIGGATAFDRNMISGNGTDGVSLSTSFATDNSVRGNYIGVGSDGTTSIPNLENGIRISTSAASNTIGGTTGATLGTTPACTGACNIIANNGAMPSSGAGAVIYVDSTAGAGNAIRANSISTIPA